MATPIVQEEPEKTRTIDEAIKACEKIIQRHRTHSLLMVFLMLICGGLFYGAFYSLKRAAEIVFPGTGGMINEESAVALHERITHYPYMFIGLFIIIFGILVALYRFHLLEIARNEQIKLGFWRIRIAANNSKSGFDSEVRQALTKDAFLFDKGSKSEKGKEMESPVPGHPGSDLATAVLNKLLENLEVKIKKD